MSCRTTYAAAPTSRRANASSARRNISSAASLARRTSANRGTCKRSDSYICLAMRAIFSASSPMRSRSVMVLTMAITMRRSPAAGCRRAMTWVLSSSIATSRALTRWSLVITSLASSTLPSTSASMARTICDSTKPPICNTRARSASSSASNCFEVWCSVVGMRVSFKSLCRPPRVCNVPPSRSTSGPGSSALVFCQVYGRIVTAACHSSTANSSAEGLDTAIGAQQQCVGGPLRKQPMRDHAGDLVDGRFQLDRLHDGQVVYIQNNVAVIRDQALPPCRLATQLDEFARHVAACHGDHLHGQGKLAQHPDELGRIGDTDEFARNRGDDLFTGERCTAPLDHNQALGNFVGAVDIQRQIADAIQVVDIDPGGLEQTGARLGTRHGALDPALYPRQRVDEIIDGRARADAHNTVLHKRNGRIRRGALQFFLGHDFKHKVWAWLHASTSGSVDGPAPSISRPAYLLSARR